MKYIRNLIIVLSVASMGLPSAFALPKDMLDTQGNKAPVQPLRTVTPAPTAEDSVKLQVEHSVIKEDAERNNSTITNDTASSQELKVFGSQLFQGNFAKQQFQGFNPNYQISIGDKIDLQLYGAFEYKDALTVDPQGNIFIPEVGPLRVLGIRNDELNRVVTQNVRKVFKKDVYAYASLQTMQPVKVFVTGYVNKPGLYDGLASDSPLYFIDKAGGIDPARGSYVDVKVFRNGRLHKQVNLYDFLLDGQLEYFQMTDGDTILINPSKNRISVMGAVQNPYQYEFSEGKISGSELLRLAKPMPGATYAIVNRGSAPKKKYEYLAREAILEETFYPGDRVQFTEDKVSSTIVVHVEGEHSGEHVHVLPQGTKLATLLDNLQLNGQSRIDSVQVFRQSVAAHQKEMIHQSLDNLQRKMMGQPSNSNEAAELKIKEMAVLDKFIETARHVQPKGQIIFDESANQANLTLEDGDVVVIPADSSLVMTHGEVTFPTALVYSANKTVKDYIENSAGLTQNADKANLMVIHQNGLAERVSMSYKPLAGDEILVMPKIDSHGMQFAKDISQIIFQLGLAARAAILFR